MGSWQVNEETTALYVCYGTTSLDLTWIPESAGIVVVHNDELLAEASCTHPRVTHIHPGANLGFGSGVNVALAQVEGARLVIVNPDTVLTREHWDALAADGPDEIVICPLLDDSGRPTSLVNRYPNPMVALLTGFRAGRMMPRDSRRRMVLSRLLSGWGKDHVALMKSVAGVWDLKRYWASAPLFNVATERLRAVGGFDSDYFLYMEDLDLCRRLADTYPGMRIRMASVSPGIHAVGGSIDASGASARDLHYVSSIVIYASRQRGLGWRLVGAGLASRRKWLQAKIDPGVKVSDRS
jgi:GT2 family glycosyltransferase